MERFIRQCENVFSIESQSFSVQETKIRYAGNLMEGQAPVKWYEAYHNSLDQGAADRLAGHPVPLNPIFREWSTFVESFRNAFGEAISRDTAVAQWDALTHTLEGGIDSFLNSIVQLMWKTGYEGTQVDDKITASLHEELGLSWALYTSKPVTLIERVVALWELGNTHEKHRKKRTPVAPSTKDKTKGK